MGDTSHNAVSGDPGAGGQSHTNKMVKGTGGLFIVRMFLFVLGMAIILIEERGVPFSSVSALPYAFLIFICLLNLLYMLVSWKRDASRGFILGQLVADTFCISILVYLTGGVVSNLRVLYFGIILVGAIFITRWHSLILASLATILLSVVSGLYFVSAGSGVALPLVAERWMERMAAVGVEPAFFYAFLLAQGGGFHLVAWLAGNLAERIERARILRDELLQKMSDGVIALDTRGQITFVNAEMRRLLGVPPDVELVGRSLTGFFRRRTDKPLLDVLLNPSPTPRDVELVNRRGESVWLQVRTSTLFDRNQERIGILADMTPVHRMVLAEKRADHMEEVAEMAASIAHEIRNPLAAIRSSVQELARAKMETPEDRQLMEIVCRESDRLDRVISDFLQFARLGPPKVRRIDLVPVLREAEMLLPRRVPGNRSRIVLEVPEHLPCVGDAEQLLQVFLNLGINALEAMLDHPGTLTIRAYGIHRASPSDASSCAGRKGLMAIGIEFSDTGPGIPPDKLDQIFRPFFSTKERGGGMGLSIVRRVIQAHGGEVSVQSAPGRGAAFHIKLPIPDEPLPSQSSLPEASRPQSERTYAA